MEHGAIFGVFGILYDYSIRNQILDELALREIVRIYLVENGLNGMVRDVIFCDFSQKNAYGYYEIDTRIIYLDIKKRIRYIKDNYSLSVCGENLINIINQELIVNVFHELNHAFRLNTSHKIFDISEFIWKYTCKLTLDSWLYDTYHDCFPVEKEANIFANEMCMLLFKLLNINTSNNINLNSLYTRYLTCLSYGYDRGSFLDNPLKKVILSSLGKDEVKYIRYLLMEKSIQLKNMSLYERLRFGFPINEKEDIFLNELLGSVNMYGCDDNLDIKRLILERNNIK